MRQMLLGLVFVAVACGPNTNSDGRACSDGDVRCFGSLYQTCSGGDYQTTQTCPAACSVELGGCVECDPSAGNACNGNDVVTCNANGTFGDGVTTCGEGEICSDGACTRTCTADGLDLIYVVDTNNEFLSFDPRELGTVEGPFTVIANPLDCPASAPYPSWQSSLPFSMSIDRDARAWVLYTSGEIFNVDVTTGACTSTAFQPSQQTGAWKLFGMGFATDDLTGNTEELYVTGGPEQPVAQQMFGYIGPTTLTIMNVGAVNAGTQSPELTGTGDAKLYGYFPGTVGFVQEIDKSTGHVIGSPINAEPLQGAPEAWAFAQWGGKFYIFVTDSTTGESMVQRIDRATGANEGVIIHASPYEVVGAGVSTCAPIL